MSTEVSTYGRIRKLLEAIDISPPDAEVQLSLTQQLEVLIAHGPSLNQETVRTGRAVKVGTAAAVAGVVAIPTTAVGFAIYNMEPDGGRTFVVDWMAAINAASTAVATQAQMLALVGQVREAIPTDAGLAITKMNGLGGGPVDCNLRTILTATALPVTTGLAANWFPVGPNAVKPGVAATPGYGMFQRVDGGFFCAPANVSALVRWIHVHNPSAGPINVTMSVGADAAGTRLFDAYPVAANSSFDVYPYLPVASGETIHAHDSGNVLTLTVGGDEDVSS